MRWLAIAILGAVLGALSLAQAAVAQTADRFFVGDWKGQARFNDGRFMRCTIEGEYRSGITIDFGLTRDYEIEIWLQNPNWNLAKGRRYNVEYWIDGYAHFPASFLSYGGNFGQVDVGNATRTFEQLRSGARLFVAGIGKTEIFRLDNTYVALDRMRQCVESELQAEIDDRSGGSGGLSRRDPNRNDDDYAPNRPSRPDQSNQTGLYGPDRSEQADRPVPNRPDRSTAVPDRPNNPDRSNTTDQRPPSATAFMTSIFKARELRNFRIVASKDVPVLLRSEEVVWKAPGSLGFAHRLVDKTPVQALKERIEVDKAGCKNGDFDADGRAAKLGNGATAYRYETSCEDDQGFFARYSIYPANDGSFYFVGSYGVGSPEGAQADDETIFHFISTALRN